MKGLVNQGKPEQSKTVTPDAAGFTVSPDTGKTLSSVVVNGDSDLVASNIKSGVNIFGVTGTRAGPPSSITYRSYSNSSLTSAYNALRTSYGGTNGNTITISPTAAFWTVYTSGALGITVTPNY